LVCHDIYIGLFYVNRRGFFYFSAVVANGLNRRTEMKSFKCEKCERTVKGIGNAEYVLGKKKLKNV